MSDHAQPTTGLAHRLVGDPNSAIGAMIARGAKGDVPAAPAQPQPANNQTNSQANLDTVTALKTLEHVLDEVEQTQQPVNPTPSLQKESKDSVSLDQVAADAARGGQQVEQVSPPEPEISPEVESYLQRVEDHKKTAPEEIVIADGSQTQPTNHQYPSEPVVVLPITQAQEEAGAKKNSKFSIRWLVEWSRRLMKVFAGKIVYRPIEESPA